MLLKPNIIQNFDLVNTLYNILYHCFQKTLKEVKKMADGWEAHAETRNSATANVQRSAFRRGVPRANVQRSAFRHGVPRENSTDGRKRGRAGDIGRGLRDRHRGVVGSGRRYAYGVSLEFARAQTCNEAPLGAEYPAQTPRMAVKRGGEGESSSL
jgi:hypothetical protein